MNCLCSQDNLQHEPVEEAFFQVCECGCNRCSIFFKIGNIHPDELKNKKQALNALNGLELQNCVSHEEFIKVKSEIENSTLPSG